MALSYNSMAIDLLVIAGLLMATSDKDKKIPYIISGLSFSAAVLCCPYLAAVYVLYGICVIIHTILIKTNTEKTIFSDDIFSAKKFLYFTCGVAILAIIFLIFVFTKISFSDISANLPGMFSDPEHPRISFAHKVNTFFKSIYNCHPYFKVSVIVYGIMLAGMIIDRNRKNHRAFYLICNCIITVYSYLLFVPLLTFRYYNAVMFPIIFIGITSYILCKNKPKKLLVSLFSLGIMYSFCVFFSSNQYFYIIAMASSVANIASFIFLGVLLKEIKENPDEINYGVTLKKVSLGIVIFTIALQTMLQIQIKHDHCFWETEPTKNLTTKIKVGPAKGIYTTQKNAASYNSIYRDLQYYQNKKHDNMLVLSEKTWCYLALNDFSYGTFSAWISGEKDSSLDRLKDFYNVNPDKIPTYIYVPRTADWNFYRIINEATSNGYSLEENDISYKLTKIK